MGLELQDNKMNNSNIKDAYNYYKKNKITGEVISLTDYRKLMNEFNTFLMKEVLSGNEIILPCRMGRVSVQGVHQNIRVDDKGNIKGTRIDWKSTKDLWTRDSEHAKKKTLIYFFNEHSDGIKYSFKWSKNNVPVQNKNFYSFIPSRHNKRTLAKLIKSGAEYIIK